MTQLPEQDPLAPPNVPAPEPASPEPAPPPQLELFPSAPAADSFAEPALESPSESIPLTTPEPFPDHLLFQQFFQSPPQPEERIPHFGHVAMLAGLTLCALFGASILARIGLHFHLFGATTSEQAATDIHYTLGSEAIVYLLALIGCLALFPLFWRKGFLDGIHWRGATAIRLRFSLIAAAGVCFVLAMFNGMVMPGPSNAPIDRLFRTPGAAWLLFGFGITLAPFFEELAFRGFLLPAFCTAFDWVAEQVTALSSQPLPGPGELPRHTPLARVVATFVITLPFLAFIPYRTADITPRFLLVALWILGFSLWWMAAGMRPSPRAFALVPPLDPDGHPLWSFPAMAICAILTSVPFALMHGEQTSYALGPFLLLICVSVVLASVRLFTRSLACSVLVHACYNFLLFSFMFLGTSGFRHLDRM